jgi:hypothetical protein
LKKLDEQSARVEKALNNLDSVTKEEKETRTQAELAKLKKEAEADKAVTKAM